MGNRISPNNPPRPGDAEKVEVLLPSSLDLEKAQVLLVPLQSAPRRSSDQTASPRRNASLQDPRKESQVVVGAAPKRRTTALKEHERQETAYLLGRRVDGRPIEDGDQLRRLVGANETMHTSRTALRHGRGNLKPDNKATNGATQYLAEVSYEISGDRLEFAASSLALGAGNCDQHGTANTILNGDNLAPGESMHLVSKSRPSLPRECARSWCR